MPVVVEIEICKRYRLAGLVTFLKENFPLEWKNVTIKQIQRQGDDFANLNVGGYNLLMRKSAHFFNLADISGAAQKDRRHLYRWKKRRGFALNTVNTPHTGSL